jgi:toxic protein SymE
VLMAYNENEQRLLDENKRVKETLAQVDQRLVELKSTL